MSIKTLYLSLDNKLSPRIMSDNYFVEESPQVLILKNPLRPYLKI